LGHTSLAPEFYPTPPSFVGGLHHFPIIGPSMSTFMSKFKNSFDNHTSHSNFYDPFDALHIPPEEKAAGTLKNVNKDDILRKFQLFKRFDTVEDHSDHHYTSKGSLMKQVVTLEDTGHISFYYSLLMICLHNASILLLAATKDMGKENSGRVENPGE
jgi:ubiquitin-conjugating enzyme E2 O